MSIKIKSHLKYSGIFILIKDSKFYRRRILNIVKYVWDSMIWESIILNNAEDDVDYVFMHYLNNMDITGRRHVKNNIWIIDYLDCTFLNRKQAQVIKEKLLKLNMLWGISPHVQGHYLRLLGDLEYIIQGVKPRSPIQGVVVEFQEFNH